MPRHSGEARGEPWVPPPSHSRGYFGRQEDTPTLFELFRYDENGNFYMLTPEELGMLPGMPEALDAATEYLS